MQNGVFGFPLAGIELGNTTFIQRQELSGASPYIQFEVPQEFEHIMLMSSLQDNRAAGGDNANINFNDDTGAHYDQAGISTSLGNNSSANQTQLTIRIASFGTGPALAY